MRYIFDVEVFSNYFEVGFKEFNKDNYYFFELSKYHDDIKELKKFLNQDLILISFNGIHYDNLILSKVLKYNGQNNFLSELKRLNDDIVNDRYDEYKYFKYNKGFKSLDVDLFLYWSKLLRLSKKISLKGLMVQLNMPLIQELPYHSDNYLTRDQMQEVKDYNVNDLQGTETLCKKMEDEIKLRFQINKERGFPCHSWDAIKLTSEELLDSYYRQTGIPKREIRKYKFDKPTIYIKELLKDIPLNFKTDTFKELLNKLNNSVDTFKENVLFRCNNTIIKLSYGIGGLHNRVVNQSFKTDEKYQLLTSDVRSLYPQLIKNYKLIRFPEVLKRYSEIMDLRFKAKKGELEDNNDLYNKFYKLVLNGLSGLLDQSYSWLYYPEGAMKLRLIGQLILTKLIEEASLAGFQVVSTNTDGVEVLVEHDRLEEYYELVNKVEEIFNVVFEHENYDRIYYWSVNDYLAVVDQLKKVLPLKDLDIKQKGMMVTEPVLTNSVDSLIIPKALNYYFIYGIPVEDTIRKEENIYLFCNAPKVDKKFTVWWKGEKQQRLNRFYVSNSGQYLYKQKPEGNLENMLKGYPVELLNDCKNTNAHDYNINYQYYISKANELIEDIEPKQLELF